jgi:TPP-dependent pyruvate/acetoin dehydrogenase alpha subunit
LKAVPTAAPIGAYLPVAVGVAMSLKLKREENAVIAYFGDGATSSSDFHVAMNFAGVYKAPIVFICRNNGWAISVPLSKQTSSNTLAIKAYAYGFEGLQVDGNDALACYASTKVALEKARRGGGPTMIETVTYRMGPHSTSDDPTRYRNSKDTERWSSRDPIELLKSFIMKKGLWDDSNEVTLIKEYESLISASVERQKNTPPLTPEELIFEDVYATMPENLEEQRTSFNLEE